MDRVRDYVDDIGFVYILSQQKENFLHEISRNKLQFVPMYETDVVFYPGKETELYDSGKSKVELKDLDGVRFIQNYQDEFFDIGSVHEDSFQWKAIDISVLTNSDYIMEKMLKETGLCNISGSYLSNDKKAANKGIPLEFKKNKVVFGYIRRKNDETDELMEELLGFLREKLKLENGS